MPPAACAAPMMVLTEEGSAPAEAVAENLAGVVTILAARLAIRAAVGAIVVIKPWVECSGSMADASVQIAVRAVSVETAAAAGVV